jgi:hypothetical protein
MQQVGYKRLKMALVADLYATNWLQVVKKWHL